MATFNHLLNHTALRHRLLTAKDLPEEGLRAWENVTFRPPDLEPPTLWIQEYYTKGITHKAAFGYIESVGIYIINVHYPKGLGDERPKTLAKNILDVFPAASSIQYQGHEIAIDQSEEGSPFFDEFERNAAWYVVPVRITWRSYAHD